MTTLTTGMDTALRADAPLIFGALKIELPGYTLRLLDGAGKIVFGGETYVGRDDTYGVLAAIDQIDDGVGDQAPSLSITLTPGTDAGAAALLSPGVQGSTVQLWLGVLDRATGVPIPDPDLLFYGEVDVPTLKAGKGSRSVALDCVSGFERLFADDEGIRLSDAFHKTVWSGETGLANVTGVTKKIYWGTESGGSAVKS
jgi:hypothetical protein